MIDHLTSVIFPGYPKTWWILLLHIIGRLTAPTMWFMISEGYHYTHDLKKYIERLFVFALISHFAYNFLRRLELRCCIVNYWYPFLFADKVYGILQLFVIICVPFIKNYNGERGKWKGMKWFFYIYYPAHLIICGFIRIALHGNAGMMIGG